MTAGAAAARLHAALAFRTARALGRSSVTVGGAWGRFVGRSDDEVMLRHYGRRGTWAAAVVTLLAEAAREEACRGGGSPVRLLDVGAGIGLVAIGVARRAAVAVEAFEPHPESFGYLTRNLATAGLGRRVVTRRCALGDPSGAGERVLLRRRPGNGGDIRIAAPGSAPPGERCPSAPLRRLDDLVRPAEAEALLVKIDVQGAEPEVLSGGAATLARAALLVVEFWPAGLRARGHDPLAFARRLTAGAARAALLVDEHRPQPLAWSEPASLRPALERLALADAPDCQAEVVLRHR